MAHEIDNSKGRAAFAAYKQPAWHGLGTIVTEPMSVEEALHKGGLDFDVQKMPNRHVIERPEGEPLHIVSGTSFFTYRTDTLGVLGDRLGKTYEVIQNLDALSMTNDIVSEGGAVIETVGSLREGRTVFVTLKLQGQLFTGEEAIKPYCLITNSHDGSSALTALFTSVRVVCANTLRMAMDGKGEKYAIRHTSGARDRLNEALTILGIAKRNEEKAEEVVARLTDTRFSVEQFNDYILNLFTTRDERKEIRAGHPMAEIVSNKRMKAIRQAVEYANEGPGQQTEVGSAYWAYNAINGYLSNTKAYQSAEHRMESLVMGTSHAKIGAALELALHPERIESMRIEGRGDSKYNLILN